MKNIVTLILLSILLTISVSCITFTRPMSSNSPYTTPPQQPVSSSPAPEIELFNNSNTGAVDNNPTSPTTFSLTDTYRITSISDYHWNYGKGATPGTIGLKDSSGNTLGPWPATGTPGQGGVPNALWTAQPNIVLGPGTYTVVDSDPSTWSQNSLTKNQGMVFDVKGIKTSSMASNGNTTPTSTPSSSTVHTPLASPTPTTTGANILNILHQKDNVAITFQDLIRFKTWQRTGGGVTDFTEGTSDTWTEYHVPYNAAGAIQSMKITWNGTSFVGVSQSSNQEKLTGSFSPDGSVLNTLSYTYAENGAFGSSTNYAIILQNVPYKLDQYNNTDFSTQGSTVQNYVAHIEFHQVVFTSNNWKYVETTLVSPLWTGTGSQGTPGIRVNFIFLGK
jgi:hypothetical protein